MRRAGGIGNRSRWEQGDGVYALTHGSWSYKVTSGGSPLSMQVAGRDLAVGSPAVRDERPTSITSGASPATKEATQAVGAFEVDAESGRLVRRGAVETWSGALMIEERLSGGPYQSGGLIAHTYEISNPENRRQTVTVQRRIPVRPPQEAGIELIYMPVMYPTGSFAEVWNLVRPQQKWDTDRPASEWGSAGYLEGPLGDHLAGEPNDYLLMPVIDMYSTAHAARLSLFTDPLAGSRVDVSQRSDAVEVTLSFAVTLGPNESVERTIWTFLHQEDTREAVYTFHEVSWDDPYPVPDWLRELKFHYFDFYGAGKDGRRGSGLWDDIPLLREWGVQMVTAHGYYPWWGDYFAKGRTSWKPMPADPSAHPLTLDRMKEQQAAIRKQGARYTVYLHASGFDSRSPSAGERVDWCRRHPDGRIALHPWSGPDIERTPSGGTETWSMSARSEEWASYLEEQVDFIIGKLGADGITMDETFLQQGWDWAPQHAGPLSPAMIELMQRLRRRAKSYGDDKVVLASDCGMSAFTLFCDGEGGDMWYESVIRGEGRHGTSSLNRVVAYSGPRALVPCSWPWFECLEEQAELQRREGSSICMSNGYIENHPLCLLTPHQLERLRMCLSKGSGDDRP